MASQLSAQAIKTNADTTAPREFVFTEDDFRFLAKCAYDYAGIALTDNKQNLVYGRLSRRLRVLDLSDFKAYRNYLTAHPNEIEFFINSISTNHTKFFREAHHFDHFRTNIATPYGMSKRPATGQRLRVWSAGCSSGEEPYTIASVLAREIPDMAQRDVLILATDIDTDIIAKASRAEYQPTALNEIPKEYASYFPVVDRGGREAMVASDELRDIIRYRQLNLMNDWPFKGPFDAIFCRNVMIYFDAPTKARLIDRFIDKLRPDGWLYIGHSESLTGGHPRLKLMGRTIYRRIG